MTIWSDRVVLVTGGSSGFGKTLSREFAARGAHVVLAARDAGRLEAVVAEFAREGLAVSAVATDITSEESVQEMVRQLHQRHARLDILANMAGRSTRGVVEETSVEDFAELLNINFLGMVRTIRASLPALRESGGSIVNMGSLAGRIATPFMGGYPVSKFAVTGYSQQLRRSLAPRVHVLLVCPGPIRRQDAGVRYREQASGLPESAQHPGGGVRVRLVDPQRLARWIVRACERRTAEIIAPRAARWLCAVSQVAPSWGDWLIRRMTR